MTPSLLQPRFDAFRFKFPESFFPDALIEKYSRALSRERGMFKNPVEFLNQSIVGVQFLGMGDGVVAQEQNGRGEGGSETGHYNRFGQQKRIDMNRFRHAAQEFYYRSAKNPLAMLDKRVTVTFNHTLGFWNYFFLFEAFFYQTMRDTPSDADTLSSVFNISLLDSQTGSELSRVQLLSPLIEKIDPLELSYRDVKPQSKTFNVDFRFNNIDYIFAPNDETERN